ncbi:hypothetical protein ACIG47_09925 [Promicromonospora sp. NPDC052451]|uniref:hypothetical protein n=1 Tax=Promicromonospora sp. NPDC052451 TaxID=3364407 RepID=UPI0037CB5943
MRSGSRVLNRALLLVCGLLLAAAGTAAVLTASAPGRSGWTPPEPAPRWLAQARESAEGLPSVGGAPGATLVALGAALLLAVLLVVFVATRGRGGTTTVLRLAGQDGSTRVDRDVAAAMLSEVLAERPDVLGARTRVHRVRGVETIGLAVTVRRGADLSRVLTAAHEAVDTWDELAGVRIPVLVHLSDRSWLDGLRPAGRVR